MLKRLVFAGLTNLLLLASVTSAAAQHPQTRDGFWFNGGLGYGSLGCDNCSRRLVKEKKELKTKGSKIKVVLKRCLQDGNAVHARYDDNDGFVVFVSDSKHRDTFRYEFRDFDQAFHSATSSFHVRRFRRDL